MKIIRAMMMLTYSDSDIKIEDVILRYSKRGMNILFDCMEDNYCMTIAEKILNLNKGTVFLTTGFYVEGFAETDGPVGTVFLAKALRELGYNPIIITDKFCKGFFEFENLQAEYFSVSDSKRKYEQLLQKYNPVCIISIERCGININNDYANMRGISIKENTAKIDCLFELAANCEITTVGIGDGGNEIGMGNMKDIISEQLGIIPCCIKVDYLAIATVSNWGAYGIIAYLEIFSGKRLLPPFLKVKEYIETIVDIGCVDGVTKERTCSIDGFSMEIEKEILNSLYNVILHQKDGYLPMSKD